MLPSKDSITALEKNVLIKLKDNGITLEQTLLLSTWTVFEKSNKLFLRLSSLPSIINLGLSRLKCLCLSQRDKFSRKTKLRTVSFDTVLQKHPYTIFLIMDLETLINCFDGTLSPDVNKRGASEKLLAEGSKTVPSFTVTLLRLLSNNKIPDYLRLTMSIYFKNLIKSSWTEFTSKRANITLYSLSAAEKLEIKSDFLPVLSQVNTSGDEKIAKQLVAAMQTILQAKDWPDLPQLIIKLAHQSDDFSSLHTGMLAFSQLARSERWENSKNDDMNNLFSLVSNLAPSFMSSSEPHRSQLLYHIFKAFKYATYMNLPSFFTQDPSHLNHWIELHLVVVSTPFPQDLLSKPLDQRLQDPRAKARKWAFANLTRLHQRYVTSSLSKKSAEGSELAEYINVNLAPVILSQFLQALSMWSQDHHYHWLSEAMLFHLIAFADQSCRMDNTWQVIKGNLSQLVELVILPALSATKESIELYTNDPEEYTHRYFDISKEVLSADSASMNLIYSLVNFRFEETLPLFLEVVTKSLTAPDNAQSVFEKEGALRMLSYLSMKIAHPPSPAFGKVDGMLDSLVLPYLSNTSYPFLQARACETIAIFQHSYSDSSVLSKIFESVFLCFVKSDMESSLPLKVESVDALRALISEPQVEHFLKDKVASIMSELLKISEEYDFEIINDIMDDFVMRFSQELEPFAIELSANLNAQLLAHLQSLLADMNKNEKELADREYQAMGLISTMTTMVSCMNSSRQVTMQLLTTFEPSVYFILENSMVLFLADILELMECAVNNIGLETKARDFFCSTMATYEGYGIDYFDLFIPFWETCISKGFVGATFSQPYVEQMFVVVFDILRSMPQELNGEDFESESLSHCYDLLYKAVLAMDGNAEPALDNIISLSLTIQWTMRNNDHLSDDFDFTSRSFLKLMLSCFVCLPTKTMALLGDNQVGQVMELWFKSSHILKTVFDLKLQALALIQLIRVIDEQSNRQVLLNKLIEVLSVLPQAITRQNELFKNSSPEEGAEFDESEEEELARDILLNEENVFKKFQVLLSEARELMNLVPVEKQNFVNALLTI